MDMKQSVDWRYLKTHISNHCLKYPHESFSLFRWKFWQVYSKSIISPSWDVAHEWNLWALHLWSLWTVGEKKKIPEQRNLPFNILKCTILSQLFDMDNCWTDPIVRIQSICFLIKDAQHLHLAFICCQSGGCSAMLFRDTYLGMSANQASLLFN